MEKFVDELKTLLAPESLTDHSNVVNAWNIASFIEHLHPQLPPASADFLTALAAALNDRKSFQTRRGRSLEEPDAGHARHTLARCAARDIAEACHAI